MQLAAKLGEFTFLYTVTKDDVLTLLRAVEFEGNKKTHVATLLINYYMALGAHKKGTNFKSIADLVDNYAQPISPLWFVDGPRFKEKVAATEKEGKPTAGLYADAAKRPAQANATNFSSGTEAAVIGALKGIEALSGFPHATEYATKDRTADPLARNFIKEYEAQPGENNVWHNPQVVPNKAAYRGYTNLKPEEVEQELTAWSLINTGGDVRVELGKIRQQYINKKLGADNKVTYTVLGRALANAEATRVPPYVPNVNGTGTAAVSGKALQLFLAKQRRAWEMAGSTWQSFHGEAAAEAEAAEVASTIKTTRLLTLSEAVLSLPIVVNAIGFDPTTGEWVRRTNTTTIATNTAPQPAVPITPVKASGT